jgi:ribosomal protein L31
MENKEKVKKHHKVLPKKIRELVWNKYIGDTIGKTKCLCCKVTDITQMNFNCGHIISEYNNGKPEIDNLLPICSLCNMSMGKKNMNDFIKEYSLHKTNIENNNILNNKINITNTILANNISIHIKKKDNDFECKLCKYSTKYSTHYKKHLLTSKHMKREENAKTKNGIVDIIKDKFMPNMNSKNNIKELNPTSDNNSEEESKYKCNKCDMIFTTNSNQHKHMRKCNYVKSNNLDTINHAKYINLNICPKCYNKYTNKQGFMKHLMICKGNKELEKENSTKKLIEEIKTQHKIEILEEKLKAKEEINTILLEQNKNTNTLAVGNMCNINGLIQNNNGLIETNMRTMTFLNKFMPNSPCLEHFDKEFKDPYIFYIDYEEHKRLKKECKLQNTKDNILYYDEDKMTKDEYIADHILYLQRSKTTIKFIVERLLHFYKKEGDSIKQSIWNIDMYRYNFTVCLKTGNKTIWHSDKQGQTTTEMILDPLLEFTSGIVKKHLETLQIEMTNLAKQMKTNELISLVKKIDQLTEFVLSVKNKELQQEIIRKISPLMFFDISKQKEILAIENNE